MLAVARFENEEVRSLAGRRKLSRERFSQCGILQESGTCSCQPRSGARHRDSALSARGEVQNETPSLYSRQTVACSHHSFVCVYIGSVINARNGTSHVHTSITVAHAERQSMHIRVRSLPLRVRTYQCAHAFTQRTRHLEATCLSSSAHTGHPQQHRTLVAVGAQVHGCARKCSL